jgi:glycosyltransferase involved in cell wall biosynthesis
VKIAQVAPLYESVPPTCYGGTERIVHYLTEELVRLGHDVTLFAAGDSSTSARLDAGRARALRLDPSAPDPIPPHLTMFERVLTRSREFDVIHFHTDCLHFPMTRCLSTPHVTTLHGRLDLQDLEPLYRGFADVPLVSISDQQRLPLPFADWLGTVPHGLPCELYRLGPGDGGYLAFLGRVSPEKGLARAIQIAARAGLPIRVAAKVDKHDQDYFESVIRPMLSLPHVQFLGEISEDNKGEFLGHARALLFPIDWPEPFGLVMIEAMACGTPVIAFNRGSVPEVLENGVTGLIVESEDDAIRAVRRVADIDRSHCRRRFEARFTARRMALDYLAAYQAVSKVSRLKQSAA